MEEVNNVYLGKIKIPNNFHQCNEVFVWFMECMYKVDGCNYDWKNFLVPKYFIIIFTNQKKESFMEDEDFGSDFMLRVKSMKADKFTYKQIKLTETLIKEKKHILKDFEKCKNKLRLCPAF